MVDYGLTQKQDEERCFNTLRIWKINVKSSSVDAKIAQQLNLM